MAGTREGAETTKRRHGENFYQRIGEKGGQHSQEVRRSASGNKYDIKRSPDETQQHEK